MSKNKEIAQYFLDLCEGVPNKRMRAMFGGHGLYSGDSMFGLEAFGEFYLKTDETNREMFLQAEGKPFVYEGKNGRKTTMSYYTLPSEIMEDRERLAPYLHSAWEVAKKAKDKKDRST